MSEENVLRVSRRGRAARRIIKSGKKLINKLSPASAMKNNKDINPVMNNQFGGFRIRRMQQKTVSDIMMPSVMRSTSTALRSQVVLNLSSLDLGELKSIGLTISPILSGNTRIAANPMNEVQYTRERDLLSSETPFTR